MLGINKGMINNNQNLFPKINGSSFGNERNEDKENVKKSEGDRVTISNEAKKMLKDQETKEKQDLMNKEKRNNTELSIEEYREQLEATQDSKSAFEDMAKLMEIARRISRGDKVPAKDEKKLMEFNPKLYQAAKAAAIVNANKKPKKYDSMFEDEENEELREKLNGLENEDIVEEVSTEIEVANIGEE